MLRRIKRLSAFTLAEVLITIGIIGIVASLTIPSLVKSYQKQTITTKLQKFYTTMYEAIKLSEVENGPPSDWNYGTMNNSSDMQTWFNTYLKPYFKCNGTEDVQGQAINVYFGDGSIVNIINNTDLFLTFSYYLDSNALTTTRKGKNKFYFSLYKTTTNNPFRPYDYLITGSTREEWLNSSKYGCNSTSTYASYCAGLIMYDGWQIKDDYPFF